MYKMRELKTEKKSEVSQTRTRAKTAPEKRAEYAFPKNYLGQGFQSIERFSPMVTKLSHRASAVPMAQLFTHLQRNYGNRSVQRLIQNRAGSNKPRDRQQPEAAVAPRVTEQRRRPAEQETTEQREQETAEQRQEEATQEAAAGMGAGTTVIRGPRELWFFNGETPPNYTVSERLSTNRSGGTFDWSASPQLTLSSPTDATPTVTAVAASAVVNDAWIRVRHTDASGNPSAASYRVTILSPRSLNWLMNICTSDATWGYDCQIHYSILNQFATVLPRNVPINEQWTSGTVADFPFMDWRPSDEGSAMVDPADWYDHIQGELATHFPTPVGPTHALASIPVYHWTGDWRVGSLTIGDGSLVRSVTWQKYMGYAEHT
jgi:hypothetical protein